MFGLGFGELLLLAIFALVFIGPKKLPELAKSLGKGVREFQKARLELMEQLNRPQQQTPSEPQVATTAVTPIAPSVVEKETETAMVIEAEIKDQQKSLS